MVSPFCTPQWFAPRVRVSYPTKDNPLPSKGSSMEVRGIEPPSERATYELLQVYPGTFVLGDA